MPLTGLPSNVDKRSSSKAVRWAWWGGKSAGYVATATDGHGDSCALRSYTGWICYERRYGWGGWRAWVFLVCFAYQVWHGVPKMNTIA